MMRWLIIFFLSFTNTDASILNNSKVSQLKNTLMQNYRYDVIPNLHEPLNLSLGIAFRAFNNIDQKEGVVISNVWLRYWWHDYRLQWNQSIWNISSLTFSTDAQLDSSVWTPDIYLYNTAENPLDNLKWSNVAVQSSGAVLWSRPGMIQSTCSFDMTDFPYDRQICELKLGSWSYTGEQLVLIDGAPSIDLTNYQSNEEWELERVNHTINAIKYECCPHKYYDVTFRIELKRLSGYYEANIIIPTFATASLILITILIPWDSGERISFAVTVMLSIIVFLLILSDNLPRTNQLPLLSRMIMGLTFFSLFGVLFTVLISALNSYKKNKIKGRTEIESYVIRKLYNFCNYFCLIDGSSSCKRNKNRVHPIKPVLAGTAQIALFEENKDSGNNLSLTVHDSLRTSSYYSATNVRKNQNGLNVRNRLNTQTDIHLENGPNLTPSPVSSNNHTSESDSSSESESNSKEKKTRIKTKLEEECENMISKLETVYAIIFLITFASLCIAMFSAKI
jgi:nicotinic acetylcholine receptor, invertebrate